MPISRPSLKYVVFLLLSIATNSAMALGLGEITLNSYLGEALNASVQINDAETTPDLSCFVVKDLTENASPRRVSTNLVELNGKLQLKMSTRAFLTEPIVNMSVSYVCEPYVAREYVLLLDPAPLSNVVAINQPTVSANNLNEVTQTPVEDKPAAKPKAKRPAKEELPADNGSYNQTTNQAALNADTNANSTTSASVVEKPVKRKPKAPSKPSANVINEKLNEAYTGNAVAPNNATISTDNAPSQTAQSTNTSKPYLVISGGQLSGGSPYETAQVGLTLRLETEIDFARAEQNPPVITNEEAMDEVTVMANRLAHLEKQILSLQTINTQLKTKLTEAENDGFKFSEAQLTFLRYLLYALGVFVLLMIAALVRRELIKRKLERDEAIWFVDNKEPSMTDEPLMPASKVSEAIFKSTVLDEADAVLSTPQNFTGSANQPNLYAEAEQEADNVLDHAEVFIAHGRTNLAIQLLQNHLEEFPTESPNVWLRLLALLAGEDSEADYEQAVTECSQFFNIKLPKYADALLDDESSIEDYPHIVQRLEGVWGSQFAVSFLNDLIYNQQSQPREGFARNTFVELFFLRQIADTLAKDFSVDGTTDAYSAATVKPVLQNVAMNEALFEDALQDDSQAFFNEQDARNEIVTNNDVYETSFSNIDTKVEDASPALPNDNLTIASFAAEDYDENDFIFETVESATSASVLDSVNTLNEATFNHENDLDNHDTAEPFEAINTEEINFSSVSEPDANTENTLEFDMSGFEDIVLKPTNEESNKRDKNVADDENLIEFDWDLSDKTKADNKQERSAVAKKTKSTAPKKT